VAKGPVQPVVIAGTTTAGHPVVEHPVVAGRPVVAHPVVVDTGHTVVEHPVAGHHHTTAHPVVVKEKHHKTAAKEIKSISKENEKIAKADAERTAEHVDRQKAQIHDAEQHDPDNSAGTRAAAAVKKVGAKVGEKYHKKKKETAEKNVGTGTDVVGAPVGV